MKVCLVVDDSDVIRKIVKNILESNGYEVIEAEHGQQAIEYCERTLPDLVFLDWDMPIMGPHEFLSAFAEIPKNHPVKILYCTTEKNEEDLERAFAGGISDYLMKPFDRPNLEAKISELVGNAA